MSPKANLTTIVALAADAAGIAIGLIVSANHFLITAMIIIFTSSPASFFQQVNFVKGRQPSRTMKSTKAISTSHTLKQQ